MLSTQNQFNCVLCGTRSPEPACKPCNDFVMNGLRPAHFKKIFIAIINGEPTQIYQSMDDAISETIHLKDVQILETEINLKTARRLK